MNNFARYLTPEEALPQCTGITLAELQERATAPPAKCQVCATEEVWRFAGTGMCFSCTTGEADASDDLELTPTERP